ncbi:4Fe-4S binding protein [Candidatus Bathyarchaeota archaeon]|jgi:pyruvate ferredoxin oxidoreductase delta subunit|nr:4Fe-4S binding protein [Candidatus Bathyarchaeota archaeon]
MTSKEKGWKEISIAGVCWLPSTEYITGDWRTFKPVVDQDNCNNCLMCFIYCPDGSITWKPEEEKIEVDYNYCKGCGICANECQRKAIRMVLE